MQSERANRPAWQHHVKFSTDWRAARSGFTSLPLEKREMVVHTTKPFAFHPIRQVEREYLTNGM